MKTKLIFVMTLLCLTSAEAVTLVVRNYSGETIEATPKYRALGRNYDAPKKTLRDQEEKLWDIIADVVGTKVKYKKSNKTVFHDWKSNPIKGLVRRAFDVQPIGKSSDFSKAGTTISVENKYSIPVYVALYDAEFGLLGRFEKATRKTDVLELDGTKKFYGEPKRMVRIELPSYRSNHLHRIFFSKDPDILKKQLSKGEYNELPSTHVGGLSGTKFYIYESNHKLRGTTEVGWKALPAIEKIEKVHEAALSEREKLLNLARNKAIESIGGSEFANKTARVRNGSVVSTEEANYIYRRDRFTKRQIVELLKERLYENIHIGVCLSGGGYRAMVGSLGLLTGLDEAGILDATSYISALSGGTWALGTWMTSGKSLPKLKTYLQQHIKSKFVEGKLDSKMMEMLRVKALCDQPITLVDIYGAILAKNLLSHFGSKQYSKDLYESHKHIRNGFYPFPIYTAVEAHNPQNLRWVDFTPFEVSINSFNANVPSWAFGRKFKEGKTVDVATPQPFGYLLGIFGSAFAASVNDIVGTIESNIKIPEVKFAIQNLVTTQDFGDTRLVFAKALNFTYGWNGPQSTLVDKKELHLVDGGLAFNLPLPPLFFRNLDIIIVGDFSDDEYPGKEMYKFEDYAKNNGFKTPNFGKIERKVVSVFQGDKSRGIPTIIYFLLAKNDNYSKTFVPDPQKVKYMSTFNFQYTPEQVDELSGLMRRNVLDSQDIIKEAIREHIKSKEVQ